MTIKSSDKDNNGNCRGQRLPAISATQNGFTLNCIFCLADPTITERIEKQMVESEVATRRVVAEEYQSAQNALSAYYPNVLIYDARTLSEGDVNTASFLQDHYDCVFVRLDRDSRFRVVGGYDSKGKTFSISNFIALIKDIVDTDHLFDSKYAIYNRYSLLWDNSPAALIETNFAGTILKSNTSAQELLQSESEQLLGLNIYKHFLVFNSTAIEDSDFSPIDIDPLRDDSQEFLVSMTGKRVPIDYKVSSIRSSDGSIETLFFMITNVSEKITQQDWLAYIARFDPLTGLPNSAYFQSELEARLRQCYETSSRAFVIKIDVLEMQGFNHAHGYEFGDKLIVEVANRIRLGIRHDHLLARASADAFYLCVADDPQNQNAALLVKNIINYVKSSYVIGGIELTVNVAVGIASYPESGKNSKAMVRESEEALQTAKLLGPNNYHFASTAVRNEIIHNREIQQELRLGVKREEFCVHYQPIVDLQTTEMVGVEALLRWQHPEYGLIGPDYFLKIAEASGFVDRLGGWLVPQIMADFSRWRDLGLTSGKNFTLGLNLSPRELMAARLMPSLQHSLKTTGIPAVNLQVDLDQATLEDKSKSTQQTFQQLRKLGIQICIENFGSQSCDLRRLTELPIRTVKLAPEIVTGVATNDRLCSAIADLCKGLGVQMAAVGIETDAELQFFQSRGFSVGQGFLFGKPQSAMDIETLIGSQQGLFLRGAS